MYISAIICLDWKLPPWNPLPKIIQFGGAMHPLALPSNLNLANLLNLLYGQTLIYVLQTFLNSGKLLFSSQSTFLVFFHWYYWFHTNRETYTNGHINDSNVEQNQVYFKKLARTGFCVFCWSSGLNWREKGTFPILSEVIETVPCLLYLKPGG